MDALARICSYNGARMLSYPQDVHVFNFIRELILSSNTIAFHALDRIQRMSILVYYRNWFSSSYPGGLARVASANDLNHDVLYTIFRYLTSSYDPFSATKDLITVSKVCRLWREVAIDSPWLWTHLSISCFRRCQQHLRAKTILSRSRNTPIHLRIHAVRPLSEDEVAMLRVHAPRISSLELLASNVYLMHFLHKEFDEMAKLQLMPDLKRFEYQAVKGSGIKFQRDPTKFIAKEENNSYFPPITNEVVLCWSAWNTTGLTTLELHHISVYGRFEIEFFCDMLVTCSTTLQSLTWTGLSPTQDSSTPFLLPVTLPVLQSLYIGYIDNFASFILLLDAPSLASLTIHNIFTFPDISDRQPGRLWHESQMDTPAMTLIWKNFSAVQLKEICIIGEKSLSDDAFLDYLADQSKLQTLKLYEAGKAYYKAFFNQSIPAESFIPRLRNLLVTSSIRLDDLRHYLERRVRNDMPPLEKITTTPQTLFRIHQTGLFTVMGSCARRVTEIREPVLDGDKKFDIGPEKTIMVDGRWAVPPSTRL